MNSIYKPKKPLAHTRHGIAAITLIAFNFFTPAWAAGGHDHGDEAPAAASSTVSPRISSHSDLFELVGVVENGEMKIYLDRYASNEPVTDAKIEVDLPDLPMLHLEAGLLEQALFNLLDNAVKFSPKGGKIAVAGMVDTARVSLNITDDGPGIPTAALPEIFKPFFRGDPKRAGTGLGLTISSGIVSALGGSLTAKSPARDGCGTAMIITLPLPEPNP